MISLNDKHQVADGVCQCEGPCLVCECKAVTTSPETQTCKKIVLLSPAEKKTLQGIRWRIVALCPDPEDWDSVAIGYIDSLLTAYDRCQEGGNHGC